MSIIIIILLPSFVTKAGEIEDLKNKLKYLNEKIIIESKISTAVAQSVGYGSIEEFRNWAKSDNEELKKQLDQYKNQLDLLKSKYGRHVFESDKGGVNTKTTDSSLTSAQENTSDTQVKSKGEKPSSPKDDTALNTTTIEYTTGKIYICGGRQLNTIFIFHEDPSKSELVDKSRGVRTKLITEHNDKGQDTFSAEFPIRGAQAKMSGWVKGKKGSVKISIDAQGMTCRERKKLVLVDRHVSENDKGGENTKTTDSSLTSTQENTSDTQVKAKREKSPPPKDDKVNKAEKVQIGGIGFPSGSIEDEDVVKLLLGNTLFYHSNIHGKLTRYIRDGGKVTFCSSNKKKCYDVDQLKWKSDNRFCLKEPFVNQGSWWCITNAKYNDKSGTLKGNGTGTGKYYTWKVYRGNYKPF